VNWLKSGMLFSTEWLTPPLYSHAQMPFALSLPNGLIRVFFTSRNQNGYSLPVYVDFETSFPADSIKKHSEPFLSLGQPGSFDEHGVMPSCVVQHKEKVYLYYIGWNIGVSVPYRLAIGLAISVDYGSTFQKVSHGPILDRSVIDPYFVTTPFVIQENGLWKMWYSSATEWLNIAERLEPVYRIHYAESVDGIQWHPSETPAIDYQFPGEAIARPWVAQRDGLYQMWYSTRGSIDYRVKTGETYRIGYAESVDATHWERKDGQVGISLSSVGWDSEMMAYGSVFEHMGIYYLLYCGNGFGRTGFGIAILNND
jgi:hypothetical protein